MVQDEIVAMTFELNLVTSTKSADWWLSSGAAIHVCHDKS